MPRCRRLRKIQVAAEAAGWEVEKMKSSSHWRFLPPRGLIDPRTGELAAPVFFAGSPSDARGDKNGLAVLKRYGITA